MQLTNFSELAQDGRTEAAATGRFDDDFGYTDEESFERPRLPARQPRRPTARELARRAGALDDDELSDIALHFGDR